MKSFYITTPLYYINDKPHLGTAYTTILADVITNYHKLAGYQTFMMTGTDEHGQKCSQSAHKKNIPVQDYCDQMSKNFKNTWKLLDISYNHFFRTSDIWHKQAVQKCLQQLYDDNQIYESLYEGWYCPNEEIFYPSQDLIDGKSPTGKPVIQLKEKNYFFKMSAYREKLIEHINTHPDFIQPSYRKNEILGFLKKGLNDLCISRPKSRLKWGVEIPFDSNYVTYVWIDALLNYTTGVGYQVKNREQDFKKWWEQTGATHFIGKDILITHGVYWPCLLMALGLPLPKQIYAHGWLLNKSEEKMSKSKGDIMDPLQLLNIFDADSLRYFLMRELPLGKDTAVSQDIIVRRLNEDLSNNLGNLLSRTTKMIHTHFESRIPERTHLYHKNKIEDLQKQAIDTALFVNTNLKNPYLILNKIINLLNQTNKFLEQTTPWKTIHHDKKQTAEILRACLEILYLSAVLLKPIMPKKMDQLLQSLSCSDKWPLEYFKTAELPKAGVKIKKLEALFPRIKIS